MKDLSPTYCDEYCLYSLLITTCFESLKGFGGHLIHPHFSVIQLNYSPYVFSKGAPFILDLQAEKMNVWES